ncbi:hypothetical protein BpHYR1_014909 [Brachionus plicatilis]|uniref:Uncharacterized protein n=1 Tax=Brachionus plicatilis TaxID=10195 RepID=A0A3M7R9B3_BRAPC|nr:hypothetical protein BpHYR1_014909 [Brachionus plicatilis]
MLHHNLFLELHSGQGLGQADHALQLSHSDPPRRLVRAFSLPQLLVLGNHDHLSLFADNRLAQSGKCDVLLNVGNGVDPGLFYHLLIIGMKVDNSLSYPIVHDFIALRSKRDMMGADMFMLYLSDLHLSYLPSTGLAAASMLVLAFRVARMPALVMLIVCCSMAS